MSVSPGPAAVGIDVGGENVDRRQRRGLAGFGGVVDDFAHLGVDVRDRLLTDAELQQPLFVELDRISLLPAFELALGAIFARVRARVTGVAIGEALDQRRTVAGAGL